MPGFFVHQGAAVMCSHAGQASPTAPDLRVTVSGQAIVTLATPYTVAGCSFTTPAGNPLPCITGQWLTGATRILASGNPVILQDSQSICTPNATPMTITTTQTRVKGS